MKNTKNYNDGYADGQRDACIEAYHIDMIEAVRAIKRGDAKASIFSLQRAFSDDNDMVTIIETEWRAVS